VTFKDGRRRYNLTLLLGNWFLIAAVMSQRILIRGLHVDADLADGITGLLFGVTIGCFIVGIRKMMRDGDAAAS
jgi:hypothetical protein